MSANRHSVNRKPLRASDLAVGDILVSLDPRDDGRRVRVEEIFGGQWVRIRNAETKRAGQLRSPIQRWALEADDDAR